MPLSRYKQIEEKAGEILSKAGIVKPPVPVRRLAKELGATIRYEPYTGENDDLSGVLFREATKAIIGVNASHSRVRQRFTVAHEIGHMCLHLHEDIFVDGTASTLRRDKKASQASDLREMEANHFAASLLMPKKFVEAIAKKKLVPSWKIPDLAKTFGVSVEAMTFRLSNLEYQINQTG